MFYNTVCNYTCVVHEYPLGNKDLRDLSKKKTATNDQEEHFHSKHTECVTLGYLHISPSVKSVCLSK